MAADHDFQADIDAINHIEVVPTILEVVCKSTGMGFAAIARVTEDRWIACSVRDEIPFGLEPGGELKPETTICNEIRQSHEAVVIDHVSEDADFCDHHTPATYGFQSYISVPIILSDGTFFGTLCAVDPKSAKLKNSLIVGTFKAFAQLLAFHIDGLKRVEVSESALTGERATSELREQFIAVLGHDLRNPLASLNLSIAGSRHRRPRYDFALRSKERGQDSLLELFALTMPLSHFLVDLGIYFVNRASTLALFIFV